MSNIRHRVVAIVLVLGLFAWAAHRTVAQAGPQVDAAALASDSLEPASVPDSVFAVSTEEQIRAFDRAHPDQPIEVKPYFESPGPLPIPAAVAQRLPASVAKTAESTSSGEGSMPPPMEPLAPPLGTNFIGIIDNNTTIPPDTTGAVGPSNVFEFLNTGRTIYNKTGTVTSAFVGFQAFWSALGTGAGQPAQALSDPRVLWDHYSGRWLVSAIGIGNNDWVNVAVSQTGDPAGAYFLYGIQLNVNTNGFSHAGHLIDFDVMGFDPNNVIITANVFTGAGAFLHSDVYIINKARMIAGPGGSGALVYNTDFKIVHDPCVSGGHNSNFTPCVTFGQTSGTAANYVMDNGWYDAGNLTVRYFRVATITGTGASATYDCMGDANFVQTTGCYNFNVANASQPSACTAISTNGFGISSPGVVRNGKIWFAHSVGANIPACTSPGLNPAATKSEIQWVQQDPASIVFPGVPDQQGRISDAVQAYYFPSIAVNSCDTVMVGFTGSGPNAGQFASGLYTGRLATDALNTMQSVSILQAGVDTYRKTFGGGRNRWGDYSATCVDPTDDQTLWSLQEYARPESGGNCVDGSGRWGTWWGSMPASCCPTIDINPASLPGPTIGSLYNQALTASAGTPPFTFSLQSGSLPPGLTLSAGGVISGTPSSTVGAFNFTVKVVDANNCEGARAYSVTVVCALPGDVNLDGNIDGLDIQPWADCAVTGSSPVGSCGCADMDGNGVTNLIDLPSFLTALGV